MQRRATGASSVLAVSSPQDPADAPRTRPVEGLDYSLFSIPYSSAPTVHVTTCTRDAYMSDGSVTVLGAIKAYTEHWNDEHREDTRADAAAGRPTICRHCGDHTEQDEDPSVDLCAMCAKAGRR